MSKSIQSVTYTIFFIFTVVVVLFATPLGLGMSPDSISYLKAASGLVNGHGINFFSAQWPPLYPALIALLSAPVNDVTLGARVLNALLLAINIILISIIVNRLIDQKFWIGILIAGLISLQVPMSYVHFYAWSEPCILMCILMDILLISQMSTAKHQGLIRVGMIIFASLAFLTRFAGVIVACANCVIIFLLIENRPWGTRIRQALFQLIIPILVFYPWTWHKGLGDGPATMRVIEFHPIGVEIINKGIMTIGRWLLPDSHYAYYNQSFNLIQWAIGVSLLVMSVVSLTFVLLKMYRSVIKGEETTIEQFKQPRCMIIIASGLLVLIYVCFLIAALSFVDNKVELDNRILVLIYPPAMLILVGLIFRIRYVIVRNAGILAFLLVLLLDLPGLKGWLLMSRYNGIEMTSRNIAISPLQVFTKSCSRDIQVYADNPWNFDLLFLKKVLWLPTKQLYNSGRTNLNYQQEVQMLQSSADMIIFENTNLEQVAEIEASNQFELIRDQADGKIFVNKNVKNPGCKF